MRHFLAVAAFFGTFVLVGVLVGSRLPLPAMEDASPKWDYFAGHRDSFDAIFVGSSRFRHQIIPQRFDAQSGTASMNLGCSGMWPPESYYFLRSILALRPSRLRWVFIELMDGKTRLDPQNTDSLRMMYWHDWQHTRMAWSAIWESKSRTPAEKRWLFSVHARLFLRKLSNAGCGVDFLQARLLPKKKKQPPEWTTRAGFEPLPPENLLTGAALVEFERVVAVMKQRRNMTRVRPGLATALLELAAEVKAAGATPIFVAAPTVGAGEIFSGLPPDLAVLSYNDPTTHPQLYEPAVHYDSGHLNEAGAELFTNAIARDFRARFLQRP